MPEARIVSRQFVEDFIKNRGSGEVPELLASVDHGGEKNLRSSRLISAIEDEGKGIVNLLPGCQNRDVIVVS